MIRICQTFLQRSDSKLTNTKLTRCCRGPRIDRSLALEALEPRVVLAVDPLISEFQAINQSTIQDADGDSSDWIEIRNPDSGSVNLDGWYLTDDDTDLTKWRFPATSIDPNREILVFASGKDRTDPNAELHTNFRLSGQGEYLALVKPDGLTVAWHFGDRYPAQLPDQSYGTENDRNTELFLGQSAAVTAVIPTDDSLGLDWTMPGFDDSTWLSGTAGVGYEMLATGQTQRDEFDSPLGPEWTIDQPAGGNGTVSIIDGALRISLPEQQTLSIADRGVAPIVSWDSGENPNWEFITRVQQESADRGTAGIVVLDGATNQPALQFEYNRRRQFEFFAGEESLISVRQRTEDYFMRLARDGIAKTWSAYFKTDEAADWTLLISVADGVSGVPETESPKPGIFARTENNQINANFQFADFVIPDEIPFFGPQVGLDVGPSMAGVNSSVYMRMPFSVDGDASRFDQMQLVALFDDGFRAYINGEEITAENVPAVSSWNSSASGSHVALTGPIPAEQFDVSSSLAALRQGENVLAVHGMNVAPEDKDFFFQATLITSQLLEPTGRFFSSPTPGQPNLLPSAPAPQVVGEDGVFFGSMEVDLDVRDLPTLETRYTLNGAEPTRTSTLYTGPITLTTSAMLQARTFDVLPAPHFAPSNLASGTFIAVSEELRDRSSNIPIMVLDALGGQLPVGTSTDLVPLNVALFDVSRATQQASIDDGVVDYLGRGGARRRGRSTAGDPKPQMRFETWGSSGTTLADDFDASLLGMAPDSDWILYSSYNFDVAHIRTQLGYGLSNQMGMWAPQYRHVEVYFDRGIEGNSQPGVIAEEDYFGLYLLTERIERGPDRVDITAISPSDNQAPEISGGYIWESSPGQFVYPSDPTAEQRQWVEQYWNEFATTLQNPDINDPNGYSAYIDPVSWIDHHVFMIWDMNLDALRLSTFFHKDRNEPVQYGPVWDFDRSAESSDDRDDLPNFWRARFPDFGTDFFGISWWGDLFKDPGFWQLWVDRWQMWRDTVLSDENVNGFIESVASETRKSLERNVQRWPASSPRLSGDTNYPNNTLDGTFEGEFANLRTWLAERSRFIESNFSPPPEYFIDGQRLANVTGVNVAAGQPIAITTPQMQYFNDIQLISGKTGDAIATYFVPANDELADTWTEIDFDDSTWQSGPTGLGAAGRRRELDDLIRTEVVPGEVEPGSTNLFTRFEFQVDNPASLADRDLVLRLRYDAGVVVHLNGVEAFRDNLRDPDVAWNSTGENRHVFDIPQFRDFDLNNVKDRLVQGKNVLAVRSLNTSTGNGDLLVQPALLSRTTEFGHIPVAKVFYTTDGTDPRGPDGNPSPSATELPTGTTISIAENTRVIARNLDPTDRGPESEMVLTDWSAPVQYDFVVSSDTLAISEINYHPRSPVASELAAMPELTEDDFEFIELFNPGLSPANLKGVQLVDGVRFDFHDGDVATIEPGGHVLVVSDRAAFEMRYGQGLPIAGQFQGSLNNNGEDIDLVDGTGAILFSVRYGDNDPWPISADGMGATLELIDPSATAAEVQGKYYSWRGSSEIGGSPGRPGADPAGVLINEILAHTEIPVEQTDSIELFNSNATDIDISGWYLSDSADDLLKFQIPAETILGPGQHIVFDESHFNPTPNQNAAHHFALSGDQGDDVWLVIPDGTGGVSQVVDQVHFGATLNGESLARIPNGTGRLVPAARNTFGEANSAARVGPVVLSELNYNPSDPSEPALNADSTLTAADLEYVEVYNPSTESIDLTNWRIRGGIDFDFPSEFSLAPNSPIVILAFDPSDPENVNRLAAFRVHYGIEADVQLLGGFSGQLSNGSDRVTLQRPADPPSDRPNFIPHVVEDEAVYDDLAPWPTQSDGLGASLNRSSLTGLGAAATNWSAEVPSPGSVDRARPGDSNDDGVFDQQDLDAIIQSGRYLSEAPATFAEGDWNNDGVFNQLDIVLALQTGDFR